MLLALCKMVMGDKARESRPRHSMSWTNGGNHTWREEWSRTESVAYEALCRCTLSHVVIKIIAQSWREGSARVGGEKRSLRGKKVLINCEQLSLRFHISYHSLDGDEWIVIKPQVREPPHTNNEREETKRERGSKAAAVSVLKIHKFPNRSRARESHKYVKRRP